MYNQAFRYRRDRAGLGAGRVPVRPRHPDRHLPGPPAPPARRRPDDRDHRPAAPTPARSPPSRRRPTAGRVRKRLTSRTATRRLDRHRAAVDGAHLRPVHLLVPARGRHQDQRLVDLLHRPAAHPGQLPGGAVRHVGLVRRSSSDYFVNSLVITIPSVLFPLAFCALAAYALAWIKFRGRDWIYIGIFALQIVPLQMALVPLLQLLLPGRHGRRRDDRPGLEPGGPRSSSRSGSRTPASRCRWASSCCTTSCPSCPAT